MSRISEILLKSFRLLWDEPRLFLPKLASTFLSSVWILGVISGSITPVQMFVTFPFVMFLGVFVSIMVASMVKNRDSDRILKQGFKEAAYSWKTIVPTGIFFLITGFVVVIPLGIGLTYFIQFGNLLALLAGGILTLVLLVLVSFASYFLPITLLEKKSFISGFKQSMESSKKSSGTVVTLTLFSMILLGLAFGSSEYLEKLGYMGFIIGRLLATTVNTYLFVISPSYYIENN